MSIESIRINLKSSSERVVADEQFGLTGFLIYSSIGDITQTWSCLLEAEDLVFRRRTRKLRESILKIQNLFDTFC